MNEDQVIAALAADLRPVRRLPAPVWRACGWLLLVAVLGGVLASVSDLQATRQRLAEAPDLCLAMTGSVLTAAGAAMAAFELSVPGRSTWWMALPAPPALLWISASGWGCLRSWGIPGLAPADMGASMSCVSFITVVSVPLSAALLWMLRGPGAPGGVGGSAPPGRGRQPADAVPRARCLGGGYADAPARGVAGGGRQPGRRSTARLDHPRPRACGLTGC